MNSIRTLAAIGAAVSARHLALLTAALMLAGCATFSPDGGFNRVEELTRERTGQSPRWQRSPTDAETVRSRVAELLDAPLTADAAVELALLNNPGLQAGFQELGIAEAELVRAGHLRNPSFGFTNIAGGGSREIDRAIVFDVLALLMMPLAVELEQQRFSQTQVQVAIDAIAVAAATRRAYFMAVAAQELVEYYGQVKDAADASAELARRMVQAGNFSKLAQMREQAFYADATARLARARHQATAERERLIRMMGLSGVELSFRLPGRQPDLPKTPLEPLDAERLALEKRLDVQQAKLSTAAVAKSLELTRTTRFVNVLNAGYANKSETDASRKNGYEIELELPLFDFGQTRAVRAEAIYMQAVLRTAEVAINARSQVREAYSDYRTSYDLAKHYRDEIVPLRKRIAEENVLRYNGMLIGVFELLADAREQIGSVVASVEATRDFWLADTDLQTALASGPPAGGTSIERRGRASANAGGDH
jgi:outer membrane protein TolC